MGDTNSTRDSDNWVVRISPLDHGIWSPYRGLEIEGALTTLGLIREYWEMLFPRFGVVMILDDDQGLYDTLYHNVFFLLQQRPELHIVTSELRRLIRPSDQLPNHSDAFVYDEEIRALIFDDLRQSRLVLNQIVIAEGGSFGSSSICGLFASLTYEISLRKRNAEAQARDYAARLGLFSHPKVSRPRSKAGRPPVELKYEEAKAAFWNQMELFEEAGETRNPTQSDLCAFLRSMGKPISRTTLQKLIKDWRNEGLTWPPSPPADQT